MDNFVDNNSQKPYYDSVSKNLDYDHRNFFLGNRQTDHPMVKWSMNVTVYTNPNCIQCNMTKKSLTDKGIAFNTVDLSQDQEALDLVLSKGFRSAPVVSAGDTWWSGFQPDKIDAL